MKGSLFIIILLLCMKSQATTWQNFIAKDKPGTSKNNPKGPVPEYKDLKYWAASPYKHDPADTIPAFLKNEKRDTSVDVFFIHPTTFINMASSDWNASLDNERINKNTDQRPILYQASAFNASCRVFAPRYRQANLKAFLHLNTPEANAAFEIAYTDVRNAFLYYMQYENKGRPVIIASHSQGTLHAIRLLKEFFDGKPLQKQLVCAYLVGYQIPRDAFKNIPVGTTASATGCYVGWRSYKKGWVGKVLKGEDGNSVCVNPISWDTFSNNPRQDTNIVAVKRFKESRQNTTTAMIEPHYKMLWVSGLNGRMKRQRILHVYDYTLFWMNIRLNVKDRIAAYMKKKDKTGK